MFNFIVALFLIALFILPVLGFIDGIKWKKNSHSDFVNTSRWSDGR